jgi:excisionase family DNA binding protein
MLGTAVHSADAAQQERWLTIAEAAAALGTSPDTVRRRIRRSELVVQRRARQVRVRVDGVHGSVQGSMHGTAEQPHSNDQVAELVATLRAQLEVKDQQIAQLHTLLTQAQRALPAGRSASTSPGFTGRDFEGVPAETPQQPAEHRRPWWRFW